MLALGAAVVPTPAADVYVSLERGNLDTAPVPYDARSVQFGFNEVVTEYVDRIYQPTLVAVIVHKERWQSIPYAEQRALAQAAFNTGEQLVRAVNAAADEFKTSELQRGATFNAWDSDEDREAILAANLSTVADIDDSTQTRLIRLASAAASVPVETRYDDASLPATRVAVLFATDREPVPGGTNEARFSSRRRLNDLTFGRVDIQLHDGRRYGEDFKDHSTILSINVFTDRGAFETVLEEIDQSGRSLVIFVHGYNNSFHDAIVRAATIKTDIAGSAYVLAYSWPSDGSVLAYGYDGSSTSTANQNFRTLMQQIVEYIPAERISIIAHSMGSRIVLSYLEALQIRKVDPSGFKFANVVFAASDVAQELFLQKVSNVAEGDAYRLPHYTKATTVYSSEHDRALRFSNLIHNDKRLGLSSQADIFLAQTVDSIDASLIDSGRLFDIFRGATRHSYVFDKAKGVRELADVLAGIPPPQRSGLAKGHRGTAVYWIMQ